MNKPKIFTTIARGAHKVAFSAKKHSPEIFFVLGVTGIVVGTVKACKATTKISEIKNAHKEELDAIHKAAKEGEIVTLDDNEIVCIEEYTEKDARKDTAIVYSKIGFDIAKAYLPAAIIMTLSITSLVASHVVLQKRSIALASAYATVDKTFKDYRQRVADRFGEDVEREIRYNIRTDVVKREETDEKGNKRTIAEGVKIAEPLSHNGYSRFFDESNADWNKSPSANKDFLLLQQKFANDKLVAQGHLFLNEVYECLGLEPTKAGQVVGWIYDPSDKTRANYVDFGIFNGTEEAKINFVNGYERSILLDFNVDGVIINDVDLA